MYLESTRCTKYRGSRTPSCLSCGNPQKSREVYRHKTAVLPTVHAVVNMAFGRLIPPGRSRTRSYRDSRLAMEWFSLGFASRRFERRPFDPQVSVCSTNITKHRANTCSILTIIMDSIDAKITMEFCNLLHPSTWAKLPSASPFLDQSAHLEAWLAYSTVVVRIVRLVTRDRCSLAGLLLSTAKSCPYLLSSRTCRIDYKDKRIYPV